jgi:hypothetical protein
MIEAKTRWITLTPALAQRLLDKGGNFRALNERRAKTMANDIKNNTFFRYDPIKVSKSGRLQDGQHTCRAVILAAKSVRTPLMEGLPEEVDLVLDQGKPRTLVDCVKSRGIACSTDVSALVEALVRLEAGSIARANATRHDKLSFFARNEEKITLSVKASHSVYSRVRRLNRTGIAVAYFKILEAGHDYSVVSLFFEELREGQSLTVGDPVFSLRRLAEKRTGKIYNYGRFVDAALIVKTYNAWYRGQSLKLVRWAPFGRLSEPFPAVTDVEASS